MANENNRTIKNEVIAYYMTQVSGLMEHDSLVWQSVTAIVGASLDAYLNVWLSEINPAQEVTNDTLLNAGKLHQLEEITGLELNVITTWEQLRKESMEFVQKENDKAKLKSMIEGINQFMHKHSSD